MAGAPSRCPRSADFLLFFISRPNSNPPLTYNRGDTYLAAPSFHGLVHPPAHLHELPIRIPKRSFRRLLALFSVSQSRRIRGCLRLARAPSYTTLNLNRYSNPQPGFFYLLLPSNFSSLSPSAHEFPVHSLYCFSRLAMPVNGKANGGFAPLALAPINYSLTDGTSIPPPPESPIEEAPPPLAPPKDVEKVVRPPSVDTSANVTTDGRGRSSAAFTAPMSPASTRRPSSIRNFLARKSLLAPTSGNAMNYDGGQEELAERPDSVASFRSGGPNLVKKKSWFRRLSSVPKTNTVYENELEQKRPSGPPPPTLPELSQLKAKIPEDDEGGLGGEGLFKNIT